MSPQNSVTFLSGNGDGTFALPGASYGLNNYNSGIGAEQSFPISAGDLNGDGLPDVAVGNVGDVTVLLNTTKVY